MMLTFVLVSENDRERDILTVALHQRGLRVYHSEAKYQNYVFVTQFVPDAVLIEIPSFSVEHLNFTKRIRQFKRTSSIPIIGYGDKIDTATQNGMYANGVTIYVPRPLKFSIIMKQLEYLLKLQKKTIDPLPIQTEKEQDSALLLNSDVLPMQKIEVMVKHVSKLIAFPFTIAKIVQITGDSYTGAGQLAQAVNADPYIATYLLKISNSVFFVSANRRINTVKDAIIRIGFNETKRIVLGMSVMRIFKTQNKSAGFDRIDFWYHSLATALLAERIAKNIGGINLDEAFLCGLLHDFGIILMDDCFHTIFETILSDTAKHACLFYEQEKKLLGVTHLDMIGELFPRWKLPQSITDAILKQYNEFNVEKNDIGIDSTMALCLALANAAAKLLHIGRECDEYVTPFDDRLMKIAKLPGGFTSSTIKAIQTDIDMYRQFLSIEERDYRCDCPQGIDISNLLIGLCNCSDSIFFQPALFFELRQVPYEIFSVDTIANQYDNRYDCIVYWSANPVSKEMIDKIAAIKMKPLSKKVDQPIDTVGSSIIIIAPATTPEVEREHAQCIFLSNKLDYRVFEMKLASLLAPAEK